MKNKEIYRLIFFISIFICYYHSLKGNFIIGIVLTVLFSSYLKKEEDFIFKIATIFFTLYTFYLLYIKLFK